MVGLPATLVRRTAPPAPRGVDSLTLDAMTARVVESIQVGLNREGHAEVRFGVVEGALKGLEVRLSAAAERIEATFVADSEATRRALAAPLAELQRTLAERGIDLGRVEITVRAGVGDHDGRASRDDVETVAAVGAARGGCGAARGADLALPLSAAGSATDYVA